jgi:hypothetical protein
MADTTKQRKWRKKTAAASITVHLDALDAATLDAIAMRLYEQAPHDPPRHVENPDVYPGRPQAIRELCAAWRKREGSALGDALETLSKRRRKLAAFWRAEASWRRATYDTHGTKPAPPWKRELLRAVLGRGR